ncbi:hypothetical protein [Sphingomonas sp.]|uniref:hypothetical protein n=1 Tax=Sphingomonas sp. TaxID=28214 RepID=UPI00181BB155|nr:hypothetical protein [Sphingomonas sp.]MBA4760296.1 hypothetical protein [Sphingomonas sp.]
MTKFTQQQLVANYMGALAHFFTGQPGRFAEFIDKVDLRLSGDEPNALQLMLFTSQVRHTGCPVIWIYHMPEAPTIPLIGLVALKDDQVFTIESCMPWTSPSRRSTCLIPDNFKMGAFAFDDQLRLVHRPKPPARSLSDARPGIVRAFNFLLEIEADQLERGETFPLPELARAA